MSFLGWLFFESTTALAGLLFVVLFVLLVYWRRTLNRRPFLIGLAAALILLIVQMLVVTKQEQAERIMRRVEIAVRESSPDDLADELSERFLISENGWNKAQFMEVVRRYLVWMEVNSVRRRKLEITEAGADRFQIYVSYLADVRTRDFSWAGLSRWQITFVRDEDGWRISEIQPSDMGQYPVHGWRTVPAPR